MKYTDILWDFNGTILSDMEIGIESVNLLLSQRGKRPLSGIEEYRAVFGFPIREYYERIGFDFSAEPYDVLAPLWVAEYMKRMPKAKAFDDVVPVSEAFREAGLRQTVMSASDLEMLRGQLDFLGISDLFDDVWGLDNIKAESKVDIAMQWKKDNPRSVSLLIGDTVHDAQVAHECGFDCVLVARGHQSRATLEKTGFPVVDTLFQVLDYVKKGGQNGT